MRFFFDNNMPPPLVRVIGELEKASEEPNTVTHLRDRFAPDTPDTTWIKTLGTERDWVIVSADREEPWSAHRFVEQAKIACRDARSGPSRGRSFSTAA